MNKKVPTSPKWIEQLQAEVIKLGLDVHKANYVVSIKVDASSPLRAKRMTPEEFLVMVQQLLPHCEQLHCCYEAGPFGYGLHRRLTQMGVINYVIRPINWDEQHKRVKTDKRDAEAMVQALDGYLRGNKRSFSVVRVPSEAEERLRSITRQREHLMKERKRLSASARGQLLYYAESLQHEWWKPLRWKLLQDQLDPFLIKLLAPSQRILATIDEELKLCEKALEEMPQPALPKGMSTITFQSLEREICDWNRFSNGKKVASFLGLCPSEHTSDKSRRLGSITKHGDGRLRYLLIETVWRLKRWNPNYRGLLKWQDALSDPALSKPRLKKIIVAIARHFAVDWWKIRTGRSSALELGLELKA